MRASRAAGGSDGTMLTAAGYSERTPSKYKSQIRWSSSISSPCAKKMTSPSDVSPSSCRNKGLISSGRPANHGSNSFALTCSLVSRDGTCSSRRPHSSRRRMPSPMRADVGSSIEALRSTSPRRSSKWPSCQRKKRRSARLGSASPLHSASTTSPSRNQTLPFWRWFRKKSSPDLRPIEMV